MIARSLLICLLAASAPSIGASDPIRLDATALGAIAIDPEEALAAREANDRLRDALSSPATDLDRQRGARLDGLRQSRSGPPDGGGGDPPGEPVDE